MLYKGFCRIVLEQKEVTYNDKQDELLEQEELLGGLVKSGISMPFFRCQSE